MPLVVAGAGTVLVASSPGGPAQPLVQSPKWTEQQSGEEVADLVAGEGDLVGRRGCSGVLDGGGHGEERVGEQGEGGPAVPGGPAADLMLVQAGQFLAGLEVLLDRPPAAGDPDQGGQRYRGR